MAAAPTIGFTTAAYTLPVIIVLSPPLAALQLAALILGGSPQWWQAVPAVVWVVAATAAAHIGHGPGRRLETDLWRGWGGPPSTAALRWAMAHNQIAHAELHATVAAAIGPRLRLPTRDEELADPASADDRYAAATARMIALTNSGDRFPQLKEHLQWYCFRRTLLGLRRFGLVAAYLTAGAGVAGVVIAILFSAGLVQALGAAAVAVVGGGAATGFHRVTGDFVQVAADRYATSQ